jgi:exopolysaccharide production protein ExoQ
MNSTQAPSVRWPTLALWIVACAGMTGMLVASVVGSAGAYLFMLLWTLTGIAHAPRVLPLLRRFGPCWALPAFAMASALWSDTTRETLRFAGEYAATTGCAVLAAGLLAPRHLISALAVSLFTTALLALTFGRHSIDPLTGASAFVGVFESKNQLGFFVSLLLLAALALLLDAGQPIVMRLLGIAGLGLGAPLFVMTQSATAQVTAVVALLVLVANVALARLPTAVRARVLAAGLLTLLPLLLPLAQAEGSPTHAFLGFVGKDATLSGRTRLWAQAEALIAHRPLLGQGFQAFWRHDNPAAEGLWYVFHVQSRHGFHFHNTYLEAAIELGYVGALLWGLTLLATLAATLRWSWRDGSVAASFFVALIACLLLRSLVEVDTLAPFQIGAFLLYAGAAYGRVATWRASRADA